DWRPLAQHGCIVGVVIDEQPGLGEAGVGDELQRLTGSGSAILDLVEAANEDGAEIDETLLQPVPRFAVFRPRGVEPPHAPLAALRSMGVFAGKGGLADTAEAVHGSWLGDGSCIARVECVA